MYLFIDTISEPTYIALFDEKRHIINTRTWPGKQKEFDTLTEEINDLIGQNNISYKMLSGIIVIVWPGSFTGTRVTTLVANALNYGFNTPLIPLTVSEFFALQDAPLPWITSVTKKEVLMWGDNSSKSGELRQISDLPDGTYTALWPIDFWEKKWTISLAHNYAGVIKNISLKKFHNRIQPLYAKDPNITKML
jgi:hypothetical protein